MKIIGYIAYAIEKAAWRLLGYESRNLRRHRRRLAHRIQLELDREHGTDFARINFPEYHRYTKMI